MSEIKQELIKNYWTEDEPEYHNYIFDMLDDLNTETTALVIAWLARNNYTTKTQYEYFQGYLSPSQHRRVVSKAENNLKKEASVTYIFSSL